MFDFNFDPLNLIISLILFYFSYRILEDHVLARAFAFSFLWNLLTFADSRSFFEDMIIMVILFILTEKIYLYFKGESKVIKGKS